jgi:hypothetical protein
MSQPNEFTELLKCYKCNCESSPYCTIGGELCLECFDYEHFQHRKPRSKFPGTFLKYCRGGECETCTRTRTYNPSNGKMNFYVVRSPPDGDCMYTCISNALNQKISVQNLRRLVSSKQTKETYENYMDLYDMTMATVNEDGSVNDEGARELPEFCTLEHIKSFDQFRHYIQLCGSEVGTGECMWGDENALQICSNEYGITFVIFNEKGSIIQKVSPIFDEVITPEKKKFFFQRFVLLRLNGGSKGQEHYDLLKFNGDAILTIEKWEYLTKKTTE